MTDTQRKIIEIAWDKTLSFGCMVEITKKVKWYYSWSVKYWYWYITESMIWIDCSYTWYDIANDNISIYLKNWVYRPMISMGKNKVVVIWHPIHFWHLMKLNKESQNSLARWLFDKILNRFNQNLNLYSQDCLSWDSDTNQLILDYLLTVKWAN